ncbi:MAG TPA: class I SAM-dependent RNA methyltransferase, partial [Flavobacteriales bacterium]|nr:class I SAM-dependent RNA methyltransferase [Flavobacteriales bacterium]
AEQLYQVIYNIPWDNFMSVEQTFRIDVTGQTKYFDNTRFIALKAKDAIVDQFRTKFDQRPNIDLKNPDIRIVLHFQDQKLHVLLDSSGESLHKRGYRTMTNIAPLNEVLAAGIVALSGWKGHRNLLDPMCGSGTILIEAAMWAMHIPAGINRDNFGFQKWPNYDAELFDLIKNVSLKKIRELPEGIKLIGYDKAPSAVEKARLNIQNAHLEDFITVKQADFFKTTRPKDQTMLLFNPPYDERLSIDVKSFYKKIGDTLKHHYPDTEAWMLVGNLQALKFVGLRPSKRIKLFNGKIEARLVQYILYPGSKKQPRP